MMRKILIVIDMQNDFIDGSLGTKEAVGIVEAVKTKILGYDKRDRFATMDTHKENYLNTQEGKNLPVSHCIENIDPKNIFKKPTFGSVDLANKIAEIAKEEEVEIELVGLCTDICVVSNTLLLKAFLPETRISVDAACCAGVTVEKHNAALETLRSCQVNVE